MSELTTPQQEARIQALSDIYLFSRLQLSDIVRSHPNASPSQFAEMTKELRSVLNGLAGFLMASGLKNVSHGSMVFSLDLI